MLARLKAFVLEWLTAVESLDAEQEQMVLDHLHG